MIEDFISVEIAQHIAYSVIVYLCALGAGAAASVGNLGAIVRVRQWA